MSYRFALVLVVIVVLLLVMLAPAIVSAQYDEPDNTEIFDARVFQHMLEADDTLVIARYEVSYGNLSAQPTQPIDKTFYFTYTTGNGTAAGNITAYPMFNLGYAQGLVAFYWPANDTYQPTWGDLGNITVTGVGAYFSAPIPTDTLTLTSNDYANQSSPSDIREDLRQYITGQLTFIELDWNNWYADLGYEQRQIDLLVEVPPEYLVLSPSGEAYMNNVVDYFRSICPYLYLLQMSTPVHIEGNWTLEQQNIYEGIHTNDYVGNATTAAGNLMGGIDQIWAATMITLLAGLGVVVVCQHYWQKANIGMLIAYVIILLATPEGLMQMGIMALFAVIAVLLLVQSFFWSRSAG